MFDGLGITEEMQQKIMEKWSAYTPEQMIASMETIQMGIDLYLEHFDDINEMDDEARSETTLLYQMLELRIKQLKGEG